MNFSQMKDVAIVICLLSAIPVYLNFESRQEQKNKDIYREMESLKLIAATGDSNILERVLGNAENVSDIVNLLEIQSNRLSKIEEKISLIESSIDPKNFRWAKILRVRKAVQETIVDFGYPVSMNTSHLTGYAASVVDWSERYDVPISLILAITRRESAFNPKATSGAKAQGLMQIIPSTAEDIALQVGQNHYSMYKIEDNVRFGVYYLMSLLDRYDRNLERTLQAYNCGPTCLSRVESGEYLNFPEETVNYVRAILSDCYKMGSDKCAVKGFMKYYQEKGL